VTRTIGPFLRSDILIDKDFPFVLLYSTGTAIGEQSRSYSLKDAIATSKIKLEAHLGVRKGLSGIPIAHDILIRDDYFVDAVNVVCDSNETKVLDLEGRPDTAAELMEDNPTRGFGESPYSCVICPIQPTTHNGVVAVFVVGVNPRRPYDSLYDSFVKRLSRTVSSALASILLVNEQKRLAGRAVEMEQRAMAMVEVSPVGSFLMNTNGQMLYANDSVRLA
jgi:PAS domain-containing protein